MLNELTELHHDALKELGNIGTSHAATALSILLDKQVDCFPPSFFALKLSDFSASLKNLGEVSVGIFQRLNGMLSGALLILFTRQEALDLVKIIVRDIEDSPNVFGEMERSALAEVGNILSGAFMTALSQMTNLFSLPSVPHCIVDMAGTILQSVILDFVRDEDRLLFIETHFSVNEKRITGKIYFFPTPPSIKALLVTLGL